MKKLKFVLAISLALLLQNALMAQDYVVSLKGDKINIPENNYSVAQVIDARIEKSCIGYVELFVNEKKTNVPLQIEPVLSESLLTLFKTNFLNHLIKNLLY